MTDDSPIRPTTETNVLLGQLMAKVDAVKDEQGASRQEVAALRTEMSSLSSDVAVLKAQQAPRTPWWSAVAGVAGILAVIGTTVSLVVLFTQ